MPAGSAVARSDSRRRSSAKLSSVSAPVTGSRSRSARATARRSSRARIRRELAGLRRVRHDVVGAALERLEHRRGVVRQGQDDAGTESQRSSSRIRSRNSSPWASPTGRRTTSGTVVVPGRVPPRGSLSRSGRSRLPGRSRPRAATPARIGSAARWPAGRRTRPRSGVGPRLGGRPQTRSCPTYRCPPGQPLALEPTGAERLPAGRGGRYSAA